MTNAIGLNKVKARALRRELVTGLIAPVQTTRLTGGYDFYYDNLVR